jgi:hypothetical protein
MGKAMTNAMIEGGLTKRGTCTRLTALTAQPASITDITNTPSDGTPGYKLASTTLTGGDFTIADGDTSGRKSTLAQKSGVNVVDGGDITHIAIDDGTDWQVTTCASLTVENGNTITIGSHKQEIPDPS